MPITKQKKEEVLTGIKEDLKKSDSVIFINFHGVNISGLVEVRRGLKDLGSRFFVAKKTLIKKALESFKFEGELPELEGEVALIYAEGDPIASAGLIQKFLKKNKVMKFLGGVFEKGYVNADTMKQLAIIPPKEVLLAQVVNVINSPIQGFVVALNERAKKLETNN